MKGTLLNGKPIHAQYKNFFKPKKVKKQANLKKCKELDGNKCRLCGSYENLGAHHIINRSLGGDDSLWNLITLCFPCHRFVHDGFVDLREYLISIDEAHPPVKWFRWKEALEILKKRK